MGFFDLLVLLSFGLLVILSCESVFIEFSVIFLLVIIVSLLFELVDLFLLGCVFSLSDWFFFSFIWG